MFQHRFRIMHKGRRYPFYLLDMVFLLQFSAWVWFQSGINTDGAHNPVTSRQLQKGDILSMNCFPIVQGYVFNDHL